MIPSCINELKGQIKVKMLFYFSWILKTFFFAGHDRLNLLRSIVTKTSLRVVSLKSDKSQNHPSLLGDIEHLKSFEHKHSLFNTRQDD